MFIKIIQCIFIGVLLGRSGFSQEIIEKRICAPRDQNDACQQLARELDLACNYYLHDVDCLLSIQSNKSHIGRITGEEAFLGANLLSDDVVVLGEVRSPHPPSEIVVISSIGVPDANNLGGRRVCFPGFKHDIAFSHLMLQELELKITEMDKSFCSKLTNNTTLLERHLSSLQFYLGPSCRPGPWTENKDFDKILKEKYSSLCTLCGNQGCDVDYQAPFNDSLKCLLNNKPADVAVTTLQEAFKFFNISTDYRYQYKYLCKDGSLETSPKYCTWSTELPSLIVVQRSVYEYLKTYLQKKLPSKVHNLLQSGSVPDDIIAKALENILELKRHETITLLPYKQTLKDYVRGRRTVPTFEKSKKCDRTLKWCTYSDMEQEKCRWLSQAAMNWGIQPVVECVRSEGDDELSCLDDVKKESADIIVASTDYAYISLNKELKSIAYPETYTTNISVILAVKRADDETIKSFKDLRGRSACLPRFGGKEHLAFIDTLRNLSICEDKKCDYGKLLSDFVGQSCVPGVRSSLIKDSTQYVDKDKLCSTCHPINVTNTFSYCNDDIINKYFGSGGALKCLYDKAGDFAIISKHDVPNNFSYRVLCKNNTVSQIRGFNVDNGCALDVIASSEVLVKIDNPKTPDIILALYEFERWFGQNFQKPFHLFDRFNETVDLLFRDSTPGLSFSDEYDYMKNYKELLENVQHCKDTSSASTMAKASSFIFIAFLFKFFLL